MLQYAQAMVIPIVLGVLISYALDPIVSAMERRRIPRSVGAALLLMVLVGAGGWLLYGLRSEASAIVEQLPQAARRLRQALENDRPTTAKAIEQVQKAATELQRAADVAAPPPPSTGVQRVQVEAAPFNIGEYLMYGIARRRGRGRPARADPLPRLFPAGVRGSVSAQAGEDRGAVAGAEENHRCRS